MGFGEQASGSLKQLTDEKRKGKVEKLNETNGRRKRLKIKKKTRPQRFRKRLSQLLHTHVALITVCVLSALDAACVQGQIICDILIMSEKLHDSDILNAEAVSVLKKICPETGNSTHGQVTSLSKALEYVKEHSCYLTNKTHHSGYIDSSHAGSTNYDLHDEISVLELEFHSEQHIPHHRSKRAAAGHGDDHGSHEHSTLEHVTHVFHLGSMVILSILVLETFLKIFAMGSNFLHHRLEVFDAFVVTVSWILDVSFYEGIWANTDSAATILIFILPWRVIRIVNSFVLVIQEKDLVILKVIKQQYRRTVKKGNEMKNKLESYRVEVRQLQGLCRKHGTTEAEIYACMPGGKRRRSSVLSGMSSFASLAMIGAVASQPDLTRDSSSEEEDEDLPPPTSSDIKTAKEMLRSVSTDSGLSEMVSFSLSPDPTGGSISPSSVFSFDHLSSSYKDEDNFTKL